MHLEFLLPLLAFVVVSTITPGPNNLLLAASSIRFGVKATLPHLLGIHCGVYLLVALCALGLGQLILAEPRAILLLKWVGSLYLAYLAWQLLGTELVDDVALESKGPMRTWQAAAFQFSNPKAWFMGTAGLNLALPVADSVAGAAFYLALGFGTLGLVCNFLWIGLGNSLRAAFAVPVYRRWINGSLAVVTLITIAMIWIS